MDKKPNIIYILADDMGYGDVSALNEKCQFQTKYLDEMCKEGVSFSDAHTTSAVCTPSRYGILTGRYNWRSRLKSNVMGGYSKHLIEDGRTTLAHLLKRNGYKTAAIGKWHLGMDFPVKDEDFMERPLYAASYDLNDGVDYSGKIEYSPIANGFDYYYGISASLDMPPYVYIENDRFTATPDHKCETAPGKGWYRPGPTAPGFVHENVLDELCDKLLHKIEEYKENPFFFYFPMPAPHGPILPTKEFQGITGVNEYADFVVQCDDVVGRIMDKLKETGLYDNTIVVYTADNGCSPVADFDELAAKGHYPSYVFRGAKADIYEGGHRVPYIIQWPDGMSQNEQCDRTVCLSDFMGTIADLLGDTLGEAEGVDSVSNLSLWKNPNGEDVRDYTVHQSFDGALAIRNQEFKLEMCPGSGGWTYPEKKDITPDMPKFQLYDLKNDIGETTNVIDKYPEIYTKLREALKTIVQNGRSTKGPVQRNNGEQVWETIKWIQE